MVEYIKNARRKAGFKSKVPIALLIDNGTPKGFRQDVAELKGRVQEFNGRFLRGEQTRPFEHALLQTFMNDLRGVLNGEKDPLVKAVFV